LVGILTNTILAVIKGLAGILGSSYALVADGVESTTDIASSLIVLSGLKISPFRLMLTIPTVTAKQILCLQPL